MGGREDRRGGRVQPADRLQGSQTVLLRAARGPRSLELATFGRQTGGTRDRRGHLLPDGQEDSQKNTLKPHLKRQWSIPPQQNAEFVWRMEDVLEVYTRPYDPLRPVVCMDETSKQLLRDGRQPLPMEPGKAEREDYAYERGGVANVFMFMEPL